MRTWLVTGASSGIGEAIARELLNRGDSVVGVSRTRSPVTADKFRWYEYDLSSHQSCIELLEAWKGPNWQFNGMVAAGGMNDRQNSQRESVSMLDHFQVNCLGHVRLFEKALPYYFREDTTVLVVSSYLAKAGSAEYPAYSMSKAALELYFRSKSRLDPITYNVLYPGRVATKGNPRRMLSADDPNTFKEPCEVAPVAVWMLDQGLRGMTGQTIDLGR